MSLSLGPGGQFFEQINLQSPSPPHQATPPKTIWVSEGDLNGGIAKRNFLKAALMSARSRTLGVEAYLGMLNRFAVEGVEGEKGQKIWDDTFSFGGSIDDKVDGVSAPRMRVEFLLQLANVLVLCQYGLDEKFKRRREPEGDGVSAWTTDIR
jgi:hypothetical protein